VEKIAGLHVEPIVRKCPACLPSQLLRLTQQAKTKRMKLSSASGKAKASGTPDGFVKVFDAKYGEWLGRHMIGAGVTDMIAEAIVARKLETTGHEIQNQSTHTLP
jgi:dihydrolipoamide dehydrogenase